MVSSSDIDGKAITEAEGETDDGSLPGNSGTHSKTQDDRNADPKPQTQRKKPLVRRPPIERQYPIEDVTTQGDRNADPKPQTHKKKPLVRRPPIERQYPIEDTTPNPSKLKKESRVPRLGAKRVPVQRMVPVIKPPKAMPTISADAEDDSESDVPAESDSSYVPGSDDEDGSDDLKVRSRRKANKSPMQRTKQPTRKFGTLRKRPKIRGPSNSAEEVEQSLLRDASSSEGDMEEEMCGGHENKKREEQGEGEENDGEEEGIANRPICVSE